MKKANREARWRVLCDLCLTLRAVESVTKLRWVQPLSDGVIDAGTVCGTCLRDLPKDVLINGIKWMQELHPY